MGPRIAALAAAALLVAGASACRVDSTTTSTTASTGTGGAGEGGGGAGGNGTGGDPLTIVNFNTRNFFNDALDGVGDPDETVLTAAQYQEKRAAVAAVLKALDPDVAVLQEVEHLSVLQDLNEMDLGGAYPNAALFESNDPRGIDIGAISKIPFDETVSHKDETFTTIASPQGPFYQYARDALELHLTYAGRHIVLIGVHFRSKASPDNPDKRLAEAQHTRAIADGIFAADPTAAIAVLGDFNDLPGSPPYQAIVGTADPLFEDVADIPPPADRWTFNFNGSLELIDHQMVNPLLRSMLDETSVQIPHTPEVDAAGDHAPIAATYRIKAP